MLCKEVGATGILVASAVVGSTDGVLVVVTVGVVLNGLMRSGVDSGSSRVVLYTRPDLVVARVVGVVDCTVGIDGTSVSCVVSTMSVTINR